MVDITYTEALGIAVEKPTKRVAEPSSDAGEGLARIRSRRVKRSLLATAATSYLVPPMLRRTLSGLLAALVALAACSAQTTRQAPAVQASGFLGTTRGSSLVAPAGRCSCTVPPTPTSRRTTRSSSIR